MSFVDCRYAFAEPRGDTITIYYIVHPRLLSSTSVEENQAMAKALELLGRIFLNHYHPFNKTITGETVDPKYASLLVLVKPNMISLIIYTCHVIVIIKCILQPTNTTLGRLHEASVPLPSREAIVKSTEEAFDELIQAGTYTQLYQVINILNVTCYHMSVI